jgi:hypothetical protein
MNEAGQIIVRFSKMLLENPARLLPALAFASVVTLMVAVMRDAAHRSRIAHERRLAPLDPPHQQVDRR